MYEMAVMAVTPSLKQSSGSVNLLFLMLFVISFSNVIALLILILCALWETLERRSRFPPDRVGDNSKSLNGMTSPRGSSRLYTYSVSLGMTPASSYCPHVFGSWAELSNRAFLTHTFSNWNNHALNIDPTSQEEISTSDSDNLFTSKSQIPQIQCHFKCPKWQSGLCSGWTLTVYTERVIARKLKVLQKVIQIILIYLWCLCQKSKCWCIKPAIIILLNYSSNYILSN